MSKSPKKKLRFITYLSPGVPIQVFETVMRYLESVTGMESYLITESRWSGPPSDRVDPFTSDDVDIGFMCSSYFLRLLKEKNEHIELCQAGAVHEHKNSLNRPVYFSDVVVHSDNVSKYKTFHDLKGCKWAYNEEMSLSGNLTVLAELKKQGFNSTFFGTTIHSGGHLKSVQLVLDHKVDAAAIDSNCLTSYFDVYPEKKEQLSIVTSLGPMPIYPVVFNKRLPSELKEKITQALLGLKDLAEWSTQLQDFHVSGYVPVDMSLYDKEKEIADSVKALKINAAYY